MFPVVWSFLFRRHNKQLFLYFNFFSLTLRKLYFSSHPVLFLPNSLTLRFQLSLDLINFKFILKSNACFSLQSFDLFHSVSLLWQARARMDKQIALFYRPIITDQQFSLYELQSSATLQHRSGTHMFILHRTCVRRTPLVPVSSLLFTYRILCSLK